MGWLEKYPHKVYASVLLLDDKIYNFKVGENRWEHLHEVKMMYPDINKLDRMEVKNTFFIVHDSQEHNRAFEVYARVWFRQWLIHENYFGASPY